MSASTASSLSAKRIATRVAALGKQISKAYRGRKIDVVVVMDRSFVFAADLLRGVNAPVVCHFVREQIRDVPSDGARPAKETRREVFFGNRPNLQNCDVLVLDAVMDSGITQEFLLRRLGEGKPRSLRLAVLLDKPEGRRVALEPDYFAFRTASKQLWAGYGLADAANRGRNGRGLSPGQRAASNPKRRGR